jgi:hypothetical protein
MECLAKPVVTYACKGVPSASLGAGSSTTQLLALGAQAIVSLRMTKLKELFYDWGLVVGGLFFVGVDFAVVFGIEGAVLGVKMLGRHG